MSDLEKAIYGRDRARAEVDRLEGYIKNSFKLCDLDRLYRWVRPSTQPIYLRLEHPVLEDIAWGCDMLIGMLADRKMLKEKLKESAEIAHDVALDYGYEEPIQVYNA